MLCAVKLRRLVGRLGSKLKLIEEMDAPQLCDHWIVGTA